MNDYIENLQSIFLAAMEKCWSEGGQMPSILDLPGLKTARFKWHEFILIDEHHLSADRRHSNGMTTIFRRGVMVWVMSRSGIYHKSAIPFLQSCLRQAYVEERSFYGGRGPEAVRTDDFDYVNEITKEPFHDFAGTEYIYDHDGNPLGFHKYRGEAIGLANPKPKTSSPWI